ncbi:MAG: chemotaxis protein CheR [Cycloclasticus sp. symbiont of Bathymodiolus heckerae]|nr:MAG: chemotaxis protein CheR [Cycloclasticus sp. symbiont of Bathymodiolus heckerae]
MVAPIKPDKKREFEFTAKAFDQIRSLVKEKTGIVLSDGKQDMVYGRLTRRLRALDLPNFESYIQIVKSGHEEELINLVNAITTNLTSFFREEHHFGYLRNTVFPALMEKNAATRKIRIWSAGCSTGEEPYSIAMTVREFFPWDSDWDVKIIATDLDSNVVNTGKKGVYQLSRVEGVSNEYKKRWMRRGKGDKSDFVKMNAELQDLITFKQLNLLEGWPLKGPVDIIFCRNVVIYFDKDTQRVLFDRYADMLAPDGHLFIGHSENMFNVCDRFESLGHTIYAKKF